VLGYELGFSDLGHGLMDVFLDVIATVDQKNLESFEMLCRRRIEKISWTDH
jgi:hypothetical protein